MRKVILSFFVNALALFTAYHLLPGVWVKNPMTFLWAGIMLGLVNLAIRPVVVLLMLPFNLLTLGLFILVINTWMVMLTVALIPGLSIRGFVTAFLTSIIVSLFNWLIKDKGDK